MIGFFNTVFVGIGLVSGGGVAAIATIAWVLGKEPVDILPVGTGKQRQRDMEGEE